jgi:hypothetical protein
MDKVARFVNPLIHPLFLHFTELMKTILSAFMFYFIALTSFAQPIQNLNSLANGALIVVLDNRAEEGEKLWKQGLYKESQTIMENAHVANIAWQDLLRTNFTFCKLFYLFKSDLPAFRSGKKSGLFLNVDLARDTTIDFDVNHFAFLQRGVFTETPVQSGAILATNAEWGSYAQIEEKKSTSASKYAVKKPEAVVISEPNALIITDFDHNLLDLPCPAQVKAPGKTQKLKWDNAVEQLNLTLHEAFKVR